MSISDAQSMAIREAENARNSCVRRAAECDKLGLMTLARTYDAAGKDFSVNIERQLKALEDPKIEENSDDEKPEV